MRNLIFITAVALMTLVSCSPKVRTNIPENSFDQLDKSTEVLLIKEGDQVPANSFLIGDLKIGDSGFSTDCGYNKVIEEATITARKSGANLIELTEVKEPNFGSTCYRIKANLYRNTDPDAIAQLKQKRELENKSRLPKDADYGLVHFYRPKNFAGSMIGYKIRMDNDSVIGRVRNGEKFVVKIEDTGLHEFWGKTEARESVIIDVQPGQEYFVRCSITIGVMAGRPEMNIVENSVGIAEYEAMEE